MVAPVALAMLRREYPSDDYWRRRDLEDEEERDLYAGELFGV